MPLTLDGFLADTWWYAMTARLTDEDFMRLADLRVDQGFTAAQVVVGVPPETTPDNPNASSPVGPAWNWSGEFNTEYLKYARNRIITMNQRGLTAIVYGAWGHQINWIGTSRMIDWWRSVIETTSDLEVLYCLTGESAHHLGFYDLLKSQLKWPGMYKIVETAGQNKYLRRFFFRGLQKSITYKKRRCAWSQVLQQVTGITEKPVFIHPSPPDFGFDCVDNPHLLAINSAQTGHSYLTRPDFYRFPMAHKVANDPMGRGFVNLEPWYEGILDKFTGQDQLYAYWASMLAGASAYCYGAHGIWNVGDGRFLAHWGPQTFSQALGLDTPRLIGLSHRMLKPYLNRTGETRVLEEDGELISIQQDCPEAGFTFFPEIARVSNLPPGKVWLPMAGCFVNQVPASGQVVICSTGS